MAEPELALRLQRADWPDLEDYLVVHRAKRTMSVFVSCMECNRWLITPEYEVSPDLDQIVVLKKAIRAFNHDVSNHLLNVVFHD